MYAFEFTSVRALGAECVEDTGKSKGRGGGGGGGRQRLARHPNS